MLFFPLQSSTRRANCHGRFNALTAPTWAANTSTVRQRANRKLFLEDGPFLEARQSFCAVRDSASMKRTSAFPLATPPAILINVKLTIWKGYIVFSPRVCSWLEHQMGLAGCVALEGFSALTHHYRCCLVLWEYWLTATSLLCSILIAYRLLQPWLLFSYQIKVNV